MKCPRCGTEEFYQSINHRDGEGECTNPACPMWDGKSTPEFPEKKPEYRCATEVPIPHQQVADDLVNCLCGSHHWIRHPDTFIYSCRTCGREISDPLMTMLKENCRALPTKKFQRSGGPGQCDAGGMGPDLSTMLFYDSQINWYNEYRKWHRKALGLL